MPVEFKAWRFGVNLQDPYYDTPSIPGGVAIRESLLGSKNFGQGISYPEIVFLVQQRIAVFMLLAIGRQCRFIRRDCSGPRPSSPRCPTTTRTGTCSVTFCGECCSARISSSAQDPDYVKMDEAANSLETTSTTTNAFSQMAKLLMAFY